jgi:hypothetical protein
MNTARAELIRIAAPADLHELHDLLRAGTPWPVA